MLSRLNPKRLSFFRSFPIFFSSSSHLASNQIDFREFFLPKGLMRVPGFEQPYKISHRTFFFDGLMSSLKSYDLYEIYTYPLTTKKLLNEEPFSLEEKKSLGELFLLVKFREITQGHAQIIHGGLTATIADHMLGGVSWIASDREDIVTANLNIDYKEPIFIGKHYLFHASFENIEDEKKIYSKCVVYNEHRQICSEIRSLYIKFPKNINN